MNRAMVFINWSTQSLNATEDSVRSALLDAAKYAVDIYVVDITFRNSQSDGDYINLISGSDPSNRRFNADITIQSDLNPIQAKTSFEQACIAAMSTDTSQIKNSRTCSRSYHNSYITRLTNLYIKFTEKILLVLMCLSDMDQRL